jgi:hypothetical protein
MRSVYMLCVCACAREQRDLYATNTKERDLYATNTDWARYIGRGAARLDHGLCVRV